MPADNDPLPTPRPTGRLLARVPRSKTEVVLVTEEHWREDRYVQIRVWRHLGAGDWIPLSRKGVSIRAGEAEGVAAALLAYLDEGKPDGDGGPGRGVQPIRAS